MSEFVIIGCHANRASEASVTLRHVATGAMVTVQQLPFEHDLDETEDEACDRIRQAAAEMARAAVDFLLAQSGARTVVAEPKRGAAPNEAEPAEQSGQNVTPR